MSDTILVDGVPFEDEFRHIRFNGWGDTLAAGSLGGSNFESPLRDGEVWRRKRRTATVVPLAWSITPAGTDVDTLMAYANTEWFRLLRMFPRRRPVSLTRVMNVVTEYGVRTVRQEAQVERVQEVAPNWASHAYQDGVLILRNLDGVWYSEDETVFTVNAGVTEFLPARGTTDTGNIEVTLTGGVGVQTLTNVSAGVWLSYNWSGLDPTSRVVINVPNFTSRRYYGTVSAVSLSRLTHGGDERFMVVDPDHGDNEFTVSSGTAQITYREAYL